MQTLEYDAPAIPAEDVVSDDAITAAVELFFLTKKGVSAHLIDVVTHHGIVRLSGVTDNLLSRERAEEVALALRGVRGVVNEIEVSTPDVPPTELEHLVRHALDDDPATTNFNVRCLVTDGVVAPQGTVQNWTEKQLVLRVLRGVRGVRQLDETGLVIHWGDNQNSDEEITTLINELLAWDIRVYSSHVQVQTTDRVVTLTGVVGTAAERLHVRSVAYQAGATRVDDDGLRAEAWAVSSNLRREKFATRPDEAIAQAVLDAFRCDPRVLAYQPVVTVRGGVVTLTGTVSNLRAKQDAERDARHVVGVWDVHNLLRVRASRFIPDLHVGQTIKEALGRDPYVGLFDFSVYVRNGKATLYGRVSSHFEQEQAGAVASGVNGVAALDNWVSVAASPGFDGFQTYAPRLKADFALAERIRSRLFWSASLHDQSIEVLTHQGRATLTGTVDTWLDREQAAEAAYAAGASRVANDLVVWAPNEL